MTALLESSVVRFYSKSGAVIGAGFLVSQKHILTCAHVVADALEIERETAEMPDEEVNLDFPILAPQQLFKARVVFWRPINPNEFEEDIAGLELESSPPDTAQPAQLLTSEDLWGHSFRVLGFPEGQPNGASASGELRGRLANGWVQLEDVKQPGYRLEPGFSGAPVWDEQLQGVVGMAVAAEMNRPEVKAAFIIPTNLLLSAWTFLGEQAIPACPYRGLFAFQQKDAPFFFGRETFTEQLMAAVQKKSLVAVIGPSGSGKSSVVFAGLIPRLQQVGAQGLAPLHIASFRPGDRPFRNLARQLVPLLETQMSEIDQLVEVNKLATALQQGNLALQDVVTRIQEKNSGDRLLLVADQFEELYTLCQDVQERQIFLIRLLEAVNQTRNFNLVLTLRADFLGYALSYRPFADALQNADVKLGPLNRQELQDAVQKPAEKQGVKLEQGLTERILEAVAEEPGNLPLLEFALTQLWEKQSNGKLTHAAYDAIGGVEKALSNHADDVYAQLTDEEQKQVQKILSN
jgi:energy-coupling factor transporter ATP-binding protein EcfA2